MNTERHIAIREKLLDMQKIKGGVIHPLALTDAFYDYLNAHNPSNNMNMLTAYNRARVYCILCNEYFLLCNNEEQPDLTFWLAGSRWKKHNIGLSREGHIKALKEMGLIRYKNVTRNEPPYLIRKYEISLIALDILRVYEQKKKNGEDETNSDWWRLTKGMWWEDLN